VIARALFRIATVLAIATALVLGLAWFFRSAF